MSDRVLLFLVGFGFIVAFSVGQGVELVGQTLRTVTMMVVFLALATLFRATRAGVARIFSPPDPYDFRSQPRWVKPGPNNPFGRWVLDIRPFVAGVNAAFQDERVSEVFRNSRDNDGRQYRNIDLSSYDRSECSLVYPNNGSEIEGVLYKSQTMDYKWDIYAYDDRMFFTRSWTGDLVYVAQINVTGIQVVVDEIWHKADISPMKARNEVHYLIMTHLLGEMMPVMVPQAAHSAEDMALSGFARFGKMAFFATHDEILNIKRPVPSRN